MWKARGKRWESPRASYVRPLGELLEAVKPNEGQPAGLWFTFVGPCGRTERRLHFLLSCRSELKLYLNLDLTRS